MTYRFDLTYEWVNEEEACHGDTDRRGFIDQDLTLRQAIELFTEGMSEVQVVEASESPVTYPRWVSAFGRNWHTDDSVTNSLHFPDNLSCSSRRRICRLLGCYGL